MSSTQNGPTQPGHPEGIVPDDAFPDSEAFHRQRVGPYEIREVLGEGGMGVVYLAEQREPVRRQVALKVIKPGMDTRQVISRFEAERQALAVMDHPNIAKVFDGGATEDGRPYFVMELVRGAPITQHCNQNKLTIRERLALFLPICQAVQHAHQKGVIHRDLKPSNIIVTAVDGEAIPIVIDFGVAKAIDQRLSEYTIQTQAGHLVGTPAYMSPEQAEGSGLDIDTRADIYSLGVILYQLLAGALPFDDKDLQGLAAMYTLLEREPPTPSSRFNSLADRRTTIAEDRRTDPVTLGKKLKGDLDWITMKAMEKDRARRYETANALLFELRRHLNDEPVLARAPSAGYRLGKFVKRHKTGVAGAAIAVVALLISSVLVSYWAIEATRARGAADARRGQAEDLIAFMVGDLREKLEPVGRLEVLDDVGDKALEYFAALPEEELSDEELFRRSQSLTQIGEVRIGQGDLPAALKAFEGSLALAKDLAGRDPENGDWQVGLGAAHFWVGYIYYLQDDLDAALGPMSDYLAVSQALVARDPQNLDWQLELAYGYSNIGSIKEGKGDLEGALDAYRSSLGITTLLAEADPDNLDLKNDLAVEYNKVAVVLQRLGDLGGAMEMFLIERELREGLVEENSSHATWLELLGVNHSYIGDLRRARGEMEAALADYEAAQGIARGLLARDPSNADWERGLAISLHDVGLARLALGQGQRAVTELSASRARLQDLVARDPTNTTWRRHLGASQAGLSRAHMSGARYTAARVEAERAITTFESIVQDSPDSRTARRGLASSCILLGEVLERLGEAEPARAAWLRALETIEPFARAERQTEFLAVWAAALLHLERLDEAGPVIESLVERGYRDPEFVVLARSKGAL
jgi:serine/threonine-protein kinase